MGVRRALIASVCAACTVALLPSSAVTAPAAPNPPAKSPVAVGYGGAVSSVNPYATQAGIDVLRRGGTAADAAVATAAALGVVEPYSAGIGGGGYFVYYDARTRRVQTIDGRETAPAAMRADSFVNPATGRPLAFADAVNSGLSVGVPGTPATWAEALRRWGTLPLGEALRPATRIAEEGFVVNDNFRAQTAMNEKRFRDVTSTAELFLPGGRLPVVGSRFRNPDLAATYRQLAHDGVDALYHGDLGRDIARTVQHPPVAPNSDRVFRPGLMQPADLARYTTIDRQPTRSTYHGLDVYGMAPSSSGGTTVGEALNILDNFHLSAGDRVQALHHYLEATRIAFADRNRWVGDPAYADVPTAGLLAPEFGKDRACLISPTATLTSPVAPGDPNHPDPGCAAGQGAPQPHEGTSTTHLVATDRWGNVASYTLTIEQTGGSAITVPHRGFLLNNELTDFDFAPPASGAPDPNLPAGGKRPRSSISPTIVLRDGRPFLAVGSPGGATIITTVVQTLVNRLDLGMSLPDAIAAPRASQRNSAVTEAEPAFLNSPERPALERLGQRFVLAPSTFTPSPEIGAAAGLEFNGGGRIEAAAEPTRRGGGSAMVVLPSG
ncbi:gamma-glutamyltransferase [Gandjariella thermophila]|uniref:Glutathione hydrolase proenzyme n=1 Tax=Gandjariella thermophila TaxID=1931992 RepID=A0A4D4J0Q5_9PSEU|nr:gamma-glutamyltransferase [Gandjariella thermophila]GDY28730.1 gamma-glutamyltranspeptidase [Gandjariella thermophila]